MEIDPRMFEPRTRDGVCPRHGECTFFEKGDFYDCVLCHNEIALANHNRMLEAMKAAGHTVEKCEFVSVEVHAPDAAG